MISSWPERHIAWLCHMYLGKAKCPRAFRGRLPSRGPISPPDVVIVRNRSAFDSGVDVQFQEDAAQVATYGVTRNEEAFGCLAVSESLGNKTRHSQLRARDRVPTS